MNRKQLTTPFFALAFALATLPLGAETPGPHLSVEGVRLLGGDLGVSLDGWKLAAGAGYESPDFDRETLTGDPLPTPAAGKDYGRVLINGDLKLTYTWKFSEVDLWAGAGVLGHGNLGTGAPTPGLFPDLDGNTFGFTLVGATRDRREFNNHGVASGHRAQAFAEWGPAALSVRSTDYLKLSFESSELMPLWDLPGPNHLFSGTLGFRLNAQWIDGKDVPVPLLEPTEVRGYYRTLDTRFRSVATTELRVGLPSLWGPHDVVPMVFAFTEGGWYTGYANASAATSDRSGWLASSGLGLGLSVWGLTTLTLTTGLPWSDGESALWWKANFNLRF